MKIGVYGGTFNPPHLGHVTAARAVFELLKLDLLLLVPDREPPHKALPAGSPTPEQRLEMTRLAGEQLGLGDRVQVLDLELKRTGRSYTSDTLAQLKERYPEGELWLLMGTDMFLTIQTWHDPARIFELAGIAAFGRTEEDTEELFAVQRDYLYRTYPNARIFTLTIPGVVDVSSTDLRIMLAKGEGVNLLPPAVYGYILREGLYNTQADLKHLPLSQLRPVALSYLKNKRIPHVLGTEQEAIRLAERYGADVEKARVAALLHDCGKYISMVNLGECSYAIIMATEIIGLSHREREIVANIVRYNHLEFDYSMENSEGIDREEYLTIVKLTAILQIANALDRSHKQKCRDIKAVRKDDKLILTITTNEDITLERGLFGSRAEFFREVYSIEPVIRQKRIL